MKPSRQVELGGRTSLEVGGAASHFVVADDEGAVGEAVAWAARHGVPAHFLGGGSNLVIADDGVEGLVVQVAWRGLDVREEGGETILTAAAGEPWDEVVAAAVARGLAGLECLSGIPGLVGATPIQNVGAYGQEVGETISEVRAFDRATRRTVTLGPEQCRFGYRDSLFKSVEPTRYVVLSVGYRLQPGGAPTVRYTELEKRLAEGAARSPSLAEVRQTVLAIRKSKSMVLDPDDPNRRSCGSFFVNPVVSADEAEAVAERAKDASMPRFEQPDGRVKLAAGWLIERAGFSRGERAGAVGLSSKHALAIVAHGQARAREVVELATRVRARVEERLGVRLVPEPTFWGFEELDDGLPVLTG